MPVYHLKIKVLADMDIFQRLRFYPAYQTRFYFSLQTLVPEYCLPCRLWQVGDRNGNYVYEFPVKPLMASVLICTLGDRITLISHAAFTMFSGVVTRMLEAVSPAHCPSEEKGKRRWLFRRGVATLRTTTGISIRAAMRRLLAVDVVNHVMRQRYNALGAAAGSMIFECYILLPGV